MNITEFHALKNFGKASEQLLNAIVDGIETAVIVHDCNLEVIFVNDAFEHIYGITKENTLGKSPTESLPEFNLRHKKAIRGKGKIIIMTSIASPYKNQSNGEVFFLITISDNGVGFDPKHAQEIYQPFYSSKPEGTGLGMSICKDIISTHQGFMQVDSDLGKGTTVQIYLPIEKVN